MNVYVSIDLEGVAGVVHVDQTRRGGHDYEQARRWMTAEANAVIAGAFAAGAKSLLVNDSHGDMRNLLLDDLDPRVEILSGSLKPLSMVEAIDATPRWDVALFVGYHAGSGSQRGILDHTYYGKVVTGVRVSGRVYNETALNAMVAGSYGVPVGLVSGDAETCAQAVEILGDGVTTVCVKRAMSRYAAQHLHPTEARKRLTAGATEACRRASSGALRPFRPSAPLVLECDFVTSAMADGAAMLPDSVRTSGLTCRYDAGDDPSRLLRALQCWTVLGAAQIV
jgi:D-amino peptidase